MWELMEPALVGAASACVLVALVIVWDSALGRFRSRRAAAYPKSTISRSRGGPQSDGPARVLLDSGRILSCHSAELDDSHSLTIDLAGFVPETTMDVGHLGNRDETLRVRVADVMSVQMRLRNARECARASALVKEWERTQEEVALIAPLTDATLVLRPLAASRELRAYGWRMPHLREE